MTNRPHTLLSTFLSALVVLTPLFVYAQSVSPQTSGTHLTPTSSAGLNVPMSKPGTGVPLNPAPSAQNGVQLYALIGLGIFILAGLGLFLTSRKNSPVQDEMPVASGEQNIS